MKILRGIFQALAWLLFTVPVAVGGTLYYFDAVTSRTEADAVALLLWTCIILLLMGLISLLSLWTQHSPGILCPGKGASAALEIISCVLLVGAGIYFRIGQEFVAFWSEQDGNPVVEAAYVTLDRTTVAIKDPVTAVYVWLLNSVFRLVGNISLAAAGMQLVLFIAGGILLYFLVRRCYGAFTAVICLGGLMLLPQLIRASMYCSPDILLFLLAVILGWVLHLCLDRRLNGCCKTLLDFLVLALFAAGCVCMAQSEWIGLSQENAFERMCEVSGQTAFVLGILCAVIFLFLETRQTAAVYMGMAVFLIAVQLLGLVDHVGCMAAFGIVMSTLLGICLDGLLLKESAAEETVTEADVTETDTTEAETDVQNRADENARETVQGNAREATEEHAQEETQEHAREAAREALTQTVEIAANAVPEVPEAAETGTRAALETTETDTRAAADSAPEIYIPESMEIPQRKKRPKLDFDREFSEEEMTFDVEVEENEEFDQ